MPGPKMGPRPIDFDENLVRQAPTFARWQKLRIGQKLRYACRDFVKGNGDDEERLMRRIMIARRNNLRDHAILKRARAKTGDDIKPAKKEVIAPPPKKKRTSTSYAMTDDEVMREMDNPAVEGTRSFRSWLALEDGETFTYNQTYVKGKEGHDWLLKKNIWRRMRYRRENKKMVDKLRGNHPGEHPSVEDEMEDEPIPPDHHHIPVPENTYSSVAAAAAASVATHIVDHALPSNLLAGGEVSVLNDTNHDENLHDDVVEAAVAAAESYVKRARESDSAELVAAAQSTLDQAAETAALSVHNPIMTVNSPTEDDSIPNHHHTPNPLVGFDGDALDVAAKLAAAASVVAVGSNESDDEFTPV